MKNEIVKYSNKMNEISLSGFFKTDLDFFYTVCAKVKDKGTNVVEIPLEDIRQLANYSKHDSKKFIDDLHRMNQKLLKCNAEHIAENGDISSFNLFSTFTISPERQILRVRVNEDFSWLLTNVAKEFTAFELQQYVSCGSTYSKGIFRLLKQWKSVGSTPIYKADELKALLDTPDYEPKRLMQAVIQPAIEELKNKRVWSKLWVEVIYKRGRGKPVDGYRFHFSDNTIDGQMTLDSYNQEATKKSRTKKKNKFNSFENQNTYDMDELEKQIVAN
jgi:plasmid replication initiation protein